MAVQILVSAAVRRPAAFAGVGTARLHSSAAGIPALLLRGPNARLLLGGAPPIPCMTPAACCAPESLPAHAEVRLVPCVAAGTHSLAAARPWGAVCFSACQSVRRVFQAERRSWRSRNVELLRLQFASHISHGANWDMGTSGEEV
jgi:hypothetical protein